jgi:DNA-binding protein HU-beta
MEPMNRRELIRAVAAQTADDVRHVESVLSGVTDVITAVVAKGEPVTIQGFAKFAKVERAARMGRNPRTGEAIRIKASKRVRVTPMKTFKETVMAPSRAPRLARGVYPTSPELLVAQASERRAESSGAVKPAAAKKATATTATTATAAKKATTAAKKATATAAKKATTAAKKATTAAKKATTAAKKATTAKATATKAAAARTASKAPASTTAKKATTAAAKKATTARGARR